MYLTLHIQWGHSAFHVACQEGHDEAVKILMRAKADLHLKTKVIVKLENVCGDSGYMLFHKECNGLCRMCDCHLMYRRGSLLCIWQVAMVSLERYSYWLKLEHLWMCKQM